MPTSIPFDPSLVLGEIVPPERIEKLAVIAAEQAPVDEAQSELNAMILARRSLDMTIQELINLNVSEAKVKEVKDKIEDLNAELATKAIALATARVTALPKISAARAAAAIIPINQSVESPLDFTRSAIKRMPLSSDTMILDAQYFRNESNGDKTKAHSSAVGVYVSKSVSVVFSPEVSAELGAKAGKTVLDQHSKHSIAGTLVITATCTHRQAEVFAPFVLDSEKAIRGWNAYVPGKQIDVDDHASMEAALADNEVGMQILSGMSRGSSFVGMVHILQTEKSDSKQMSDQFAAKIEAKMRSGSFLAKKSGTFGVDASVASNVKSLLSTSSLESHASVITMGIIPSIKASAVKTSVDQLKPQPTEVMGQLAAIQGAGDNDVNSFASEARSATDGASFMTLNNSYVTSVVSELGQLDTANNMVIDTNSMMTALDDYVQKAIEGDCGVPINFYLAPISAKQLAKAYLEEFYPDKETAA